MKKIVLILMLILLTIIKANNDVSYTISRISANNIYDFKFELLYDNVLGTYYNAVEEQTNNNPHITGSGYRINPDSASSLRIIAISQVMLDDLYRLSLISDNKNDNRFNGKIRYGDTIYIKTSYKNLEGWWVVRDAMNKRYENRIDFLLSINDTSMSQGIFRNLNLMKLRYGYYSQL